MVQIPDLAWVTEPGPPGVISIIGCGVHFIATWEFLSLTIDFHPWQYCHAGCLHLCRPVTMVIVTALGLKQCSWCLPSRQHPIFGYHNQMCHLCTLQHIHAPWEQAQEGCSSREGLCSIHTVAPEDFFLEVNCGNVSMLNIQ